MTYRMVALDVDGTLLDDEHRLSPRTAETLRRVYERGTDIVLCTGRSISNTGPILEELGIDGAVVTHNGAATVHAGDRTLLHECSFPAAEVLPFVTYCRREGIHFDYCTPFELYVENLPEDARLMYEDFMHEPLLHPDLTAFEEPLVKFTVFAPEEVMDRVESEWRQMKSPLLLLRSHRFFIDIVHPDASKGNALRRLAEAKGVAPSQILAMGNYYNDLSMLEYAGLGIAMENSPDDVKAAADEVAESNNEEGVAKALAKHFGLEKG
ncbi:sugar phosphate phosphatase [Paenibacillus sp. J31TS4]|uniref:Cof-type HAD-IIB family hydrolase n=1 Tax=Paenibacillus sp. J31TS4 TaxID=2807195 RepID=UPI001B154F13|nr:Cof-type HAD-IIB family hydrolase [Paenibacillus sp. J31TS4]GIP37974.1 sugar phosphate phosphatase [Paenibacillus sp. J31TS4]